MAEDCWLALKALNTRNRKFSSSPALGPLDAGGAAKVVTGGSQMRREGNAEYKTV